MKDASFTGGENIHRFTQYTSIHTIYIDLHNIHRFTQYTLIHTGSETQSTGKLNIDRRGPLGLFLPKERIYIDLHDIHWLTTIYIDTQYTLIYTIYIDSQQYTSTHNNIHWHTIYIDLRDIHWLTTIYIDTQYTLSHGIYVVSWNIHFLALTARRSQKKYTLIHTIYIDPQYYTLIHNNIH